MGSTNPNRFLPSQWFKAATRQIAQKPQKQTIQKSRKEVTGTASDPSTEHCKTNPPDLLSMSPLSNFSIGSSSKFSQINDYSHNYFLRSHKTRNPGYYPKKFFHSTSQKNKKPYVYSSNCVSSEGSNTPQKNEFNTSNSNQSSNQIIHETNLGSKSFNKSSPTSTSYLQENSNQYKAGHLQKTFSTIPETPNENRSNNFCMRDSTERRQPDLKENLKRKWIKLPYKPSGVVGTCSVLSYNILSQTLLEVNDHLYENCEQNVLPWTYRWRNIKSELETFHMDVVCLQEVEEAHYHESIKPWLELNGYFHVYKRRTGNDINKPDGVLTACSCDKFEIVATIPVEYYRPNNDLTNWHNVGLIVVLKMNGKNHKKNPYICVGNTHLVYNPKRGDIKLIQLATFFAEIDRVINKYSRELGYKLPLVICGDFNSTPISPFYNFITKGNLTYEGMSSRRVSGQKTHRGGRDLPDCLLPSVLKVDDNCTFIKDDPSNSQLRNHILTHSLGPLSSTGHRHRHYEATTTQDGGITVDYIFYSDSQRPGQSGSSSSSSGTFQSLRYCLVVNERLEPSSCRDIGRARGIPNSVHSSDHLPVVASFFLVDTGS